LPNIVAFIINPAVDISTSVPVVQPAYKLRCEEVRRDPGGGGINVARVAMRLGADVLAVFTVGGPIGDHHKDLVKQEGIRSLTIPIRNDTREDFSVVKTETGQQYRFVLPGPVLTETEWRACLESLASFDARSRFLVASGSLPPGVPDDFYARLVTTMRAGDVKFIVDTSGPPLKRALETGVYLIKPNLREMRELVGEAMESEVDCIVACRALVDAGRAEVVALKHCGFLLLRYSPSQRASERCGVCFASSASSRFCIVCRSVSLTEVSSKCRYRMMF